MTTSITGPQPGTEMNALMTGAEYLESLRETNEFEKKRRETNRNVEPVSARPDGAGHD